MRPAIKRHLAIRLLPDGNILFGTDKNAQSVDLDETISHLFALMDGDTEIAAINSAMRSRFPQIAPGDIESVVSQLMEANLVEDRDIEPPENLSPLELARYDRQLLFFSGFEHGTPQRYSFQSALKKAHVTLLGCGGVGSHTFLNLARAGVGTLRVVDFDQVEVSNLNRSFIFRGSDIGKRKTEVLREQAEAVNPHVIYDIIDREIKGYDDVSELITDTDFVVLCADKPYLRINQWVNFACLSHNIPYGLAGSSEEFGTVGPITIPFETSCFDCQDFDRTDLFSGPDFLVRANQERKAPSFVSVIAAFASLNSLEIVKHLTRISTPSTYNRQLKIDFQELSFEYIDLPRKAECPSCSKLSGEEKVKNE